MSSSPLSSPSSSWCQKCKAKSKDPFLIQSLSKPRVATLNSSRQDKKSNRRKTKTSPPTIPCWLPEASSAADFQNLGRLTCLAIQMSCVSCRVLTLPGFTTHRWICCTRQKVLGQDSTAYQPKSSAAHTDKELFILHSVGNSPSPLQGTQRSRIKKARQQERGPQSFMPFIQLPSSHSK